MKAKKAGKIRKPWFSTMHVLGYVEKYDLLSGLATTPSIMTFRQLLRGGCRECEEIFEKYLEAWEDQQGEEGCSYLGKRYS